MKKRTQKGLFMVLKVFISISLMSWVWGKVTGLTDTLVDFLPSLHGLEKYSILKNIFGLALVIIFCWIFGFFKKYFAYIDKVLKRIPVFKEFYQPIASLISLIDRDKDFKEVYWVKLDGENGPISLGFQTNETPVIIEGEEHYPILVLLTLSTSGYVKWLPKNKLIQCDLTVKEALNYNFSGGTNYQKD